MHTFIDVTVASNYYGAKNHTIKTTEAIDAAVLSYVSRFVEVRQFRRLKPNPLNSLLFAPGFFDHPQKRQAAVRMIAIAEKLLEALGSGVVDAAGQRSGKMEVRELSKIFNHWILSIGLYYCPPHTCFIRIIYEYFDV